MLGNDLVTIFHKLADRQYVKTVYKNCLWRAGSGSAAASQGNTPASNVAVYMPLSPFPTVEAGDIIMRGDRSSVTSTAPKDLLALADSATVTYVYKNDFGSAAVSHIKVVGV